MQRVENMLIHINPRDLLSRKRKWSKDKYPQMDDELKEYEYFGGEEGRHRNFLIQRMRSYPELQLPPREEQCYCDHYIEKQCYLFNPDLHHVEVVGSCCIKRFQKRRLCRTCKTPHSGTKYDQCQACRKNDERHKIEERKRLAMEAEMERARLYREERERQKRAEDERFKEAWRSGTVRDKLCTYNLHNLQRLASQKCILRYEHYDKDALIGVLLTVTTDRDLPIR